MSNQNELCNKFNEISQGQEFISKEQLKNFLTLEKDKNGSQVITDSEIEEVFNLMDENHDGQISFEEFCLFSAFSKSITKPFIKNIKPLLKVVQDQKEMNQNTQNSNFDVHVKLFSENYDESQTKTRLKISIAERLHSSVAQIHALSSLKDLSFGVLLKNVNDQDAIVEKLEEFSSNLKEILLDLGADYQDTINAITFSSHKEGQDVLLLINFGQIQIFKEMIGAFQQYITYVKKQLEFLTIDIQSHLDFSEYKHFTLSKLGQSQLQVKVDLKSNVNVLKIPAMKQLIAKLKEQEKIGELFGVILALSVQSAKLDIAMNEEKKTEFFKSFMDENTTGHHILEQAIQHLDEQGISEIMATFSFIEDLIEALKDQKIDTVEYFFILNDLVMTIETKGHFYDLVNDLGIF